MTPRRPTAVLVVGLPASDIAAVASYLGDLGLSRLAAPAATRLAGISDKVLDRLGRTWDDPPQPGEIERELDSLVRRYGEEAVGTFERGGTTGAPAVWADMRSALLLPFWRAALGRDLAAVLLTGDPLAAARQLERQESLGLTTSLALWERYHHLATRGAEGLPAFVAAGTVGGGCDLPHDAAAGLTAWLEGLGVPAAESAGSAGGAARSAGRSASRTTPAPPPTGEDDLVLPEQRAVLAALLTALGPHRSFAPPELPPESPWTTAELLQRHEARTLSRAAEWLGSELATLTAPEQPAPGDDELSYRYPLDATSDEAHYHEWLRTRGEPTSVGTAAVLRPSTAPPDRGIRPQFSVVVPAYETPLWAIDRCVSSVLAQDLASFELVIVDDASSDARLREHLRHLESADPRVVVRARRENGGIAAATNDGVAAARGEWVAFLDHDDELTPDALSSLAAAVAESPQARLIYSDEDKIDEAGRRHMPAFKPDWSPDLLLSNAYMCHLLAVRSDLLRELGGLRSAYDGAQDYDLMLRATERLADDAIVHVPKILYHWRAMHGSAAGDPAAKPWAFEAGRSALEDAVQRRGIPAEPVEMHPRVPGSYIIRRRVVGRPLVSAIIPFRDEAPLLASCYRSFVAEPGHDDFELLLVDNDSALPETKAVANELARDRRVRLLEAPGPFNWVRINNEAAHKARGDVLLFLNNDVEARSAGWLAEMVAHAQRDDVGAVGARLLFPDGTIQHGGVAIGLCLGAAHVQEGLDGSQPGYLSAVSVVRNTSAVTGACLMTRRDVFESAGGFDESLPVAFSDIDYCLRLRAAGKLVVYTPVAELVHHESKTRGHTDDEAERPFFRARWREMMLRGDPYYNPNLGRFDHFCRLPGDEEDKQWKMFLSMLNVSSRS